MKTKFIAASALAGMCMFAATQASATVVTVTLTGTVDSQFFNSDWGINPFASVSNGDAYKAIYTFDTAQAPIFIAGPGVTTAYGGTSLGLGTFGHVDVTVSGLSYSLDGTYYGEIQATDPNLSQNVWQGNGMSGPDYNLIAVINNEQGIFPVDFTTPGTYDLTSTNSIGQIDVETVSGGSWITGGLLIIGLQSVTVADDTQTGGGSGTGVPEPASLSLFAAGLMGAPFFRRKKNNRPVSACA